MKTIGWIESCFCFYTIWYWVMKTKRTRLAPIAVASLLAGVRQARYSVQRDDSCGKVGMAASKNQYHYFS